MCDVIKEWVQNRLGIIFDIHPPNFPLNVRDGRIISKLLHSYDVITSEQLELIMPCTDSVTIRENFKYIKGWLKNLGLKIHEEFSYFGEKSSYSLKLLYHLYLTLQDKDKLYFITQGKANEEMLTANTRFSVDYVYEQYPNRVTVPDNPLSDYLVKHEHVIDWQKDKYQNLLEKIQNTREKYKEYISEKFGLCYTEKTPKLKTFSQFMQEESSVPDIGEDFKDLIYDELVEEEKAALAKAQFIPNPKESKKIINRIRRKIRKQVKDNVLKLQMEKILLYELWTAIIEKQHAMFEESIGKKMLKQSLYEKQMAMKSGMKKK